MRVRAEERRKKKKGRTKAEKKKKRRRWRRREEGYRPGSVKELSHGRVKRLGFYRY